MDNVHAQRLGTTALKYALALKSRQLWARLHVVCRGARDEPRVLEPEVVTGGPRDGGRGKLKQCRVMTVLTEPTPLAAARGLNREVVAMVGVNTHDKAAVHHSAYQIRINGMASHV